MENTEHILVCKVCDAKIPDYLGNHLLEVHGLDAKGYFRQYPGAPTVSARLMARLQARQTPPRKHPPEPKDLTVSVGAFNFKVDPDVPESACLPLPEHYRIPTHRDLPDNPSRSAGNNQPFEAGESLCKDIHHALVALHPALSGHPHQPVTSMYLHGISGAGKDAFVHALSAWLRRPGIARSIVPGADIQSWFYSRSFDQHGTTWEEGPLLKRLRDGYVVRDAAGKEVRRVPYIVLLSDLDRAEPSQVEHLRLILDSIQGRVEGPGGEMYPVYPGTILIATGNTMGSGDTRGRYVSANVMDGTIVNRFSAVFEFHWMSWEDEAAVARLKFPELTATMPDLLPRMGKCVQVVRNAILNDQLFADFDHRAVCAVLRHAENLGNLDGRGLKAHQLLKGAFRIWLDRLPDKQTRGFAVKLLDPHLKDGTLPRGDTSRTDAGSGELENF